MINYSTEFPINPKNSVSDVLSVACNWIQSSPHTEIPKGTSIVTPPQGETRYDYDSESVIIGTAHAPSYTIGGIRYTKVEKSNLEWTSTIVARKTLDQHLVTIQVSCEALTITTDLPPPKKPLIIQKILTSLGGGMDGQIPITNKPFILAPGEEEIAAALISGVAGNRLPIVYVSYSHHETGFDPTSLAKFSCGLAHVVVEPNRAFSFRLKDLVHARNVYGGTVGVYWPDSYMRSRYYTSNTQSPCESIQAKLLNDIRTILANRRLAPDCNWLHLQELISRNKYDQLKSVGETELSEWYEVYKSEIRAKNNTISDAEKEIHRLNAELRIANAQIQDSGQLLDTGVEQDLYESEIKDIIIQSITAATNNCPPDSRRLHVLTDIIKANPIRGEANRVINEIKQLLKTYTSMDARTRGSLLKIGFSISEDGKHYKLIFQNDPRYTFSLSKSGSDHRGGKNMTSDIKNKLF